MNKIINILMFLIIILFLFGITKYYLSNKNVDNYNFNRTNINEIIKQKTLNLPVLANDTNNVIEFNNSITKGTDNKKKRSFWDLLKNK